MIIEKSRNYGMVLQRNLLPDADEKTKIAIFRFRVDIGIELVRAGIEMTKENIDLIYDGLPKEVLYRELAERM